MNSKVKQQVLSLALAILVLIVSITPVLAAEDAGAGGGVGDFEARMAAKYPKGMLEAELPD